ncbi:MAG: radical SAM protein [Candidatus Coatesbacteria bacterium]|nr:radical SAM protein [Candidatus Coatesbacteria bacterium]
MRRAARWPRCLLVETSTLCNLHCPWCGVVLDVSGRRRQFMPKADFARLLDTASAHITALTFIRTGEPLVNPDILEMIEMTVSRSLMVTLNSNLATMPEGVAEALVDIAPHRIVTTLISADPEEYEAKQVGAALERTVWNIASVCSTKKRRGKQFPMVEVQLIATKSSVNQIEQFRRIVERVGCDAAYLKPMRVDTARQDEQYREVHIDDLPIGHDVCNYELDPKGNPVLKYANSCPQAENVFVTVDGDVYPCLFAVGKSEPYGNLISDCWSAVWKKSGLSRRKRTHLMRRGDAMCSACIPSVEIGIRVAAKPGPAEESR